MSTGHRVAAHRFVCVAWLSLGFAVAAAGLASAQPPSAGDPTASLQEFSSVRDQANAVAVNWNSGAKLFRVDLWGAYTRSRFQPAGARFLYFAPKAEGIAFEVRVEGRKMFHGPYAIDGSAKPEALPDGVLTPEEAVRRLWDLAPTLRFDQIYVQLLRPGVEQPVAVASNEEPTSFPLYGVLRHLPVRLQDRETDAPKRKPVWRMLAVRDRNVVVDRAYGTFLYLDAATGAPLSKREPAVGVQIYMRHKLIPPSPINEFVFPEGEIVLDSPAEQVGTFDKLAVAQKSESICLGLRGLVRDGRSDDEIRAAIDKMANWWDRIEAVRRDDAARGLAVLEQAVKEDPQDLGRQVALFKRLIDEIEREKKVALASPLVTDVGNGRKREFWFDRQFETTKEALGTRNQTHTVLNLRTGEWLYRMEDPPNTHVFSTHLRAALATIKAINGLGKNDLEFERQLTRLNWLIAGNGAALGQGDSLNPADPLQLMIYAEYNRVRGSENLLSAERLRLPKSWSTSSRRNIGGGKVEVTTTTYTRPPTAAELAAADRMDQLTRTKDAPRVAAVEDLAFKLEPMDPRIYYLWARVEAVFYDQQLADRVIERGLMVDPGSAELHAARQVAWRRNSNVNQAEVGLADRFARPYMPADLQGGTKLANLDPVAAYFFTLQRLRISPDDAGSHTVLSQVIARLNGVKINNLEIMPDALEQEQRELAVSALMVNRLLDRQSEWQKGLPHGVPATRENLVKNEVNLLTLRGNVLKTLERDEEARGCFQKALAIDPTNAEAQKGLK
jgi:tetratricopeptide (TPR) repeat protein